MSNESVAAQMLPETAITTISEDQVADYLNENPDFFLAHQELLAEITLPHESGEAVSLLERQVKLLRERNYSLSEQLGNLLENASRNDHIFEITRSLVLSLLRADTPDALITAVQDTLLTQDNIDACTLVLDARVGVSPPRGAEPADLTTRFADVFRLRHTHCGRPTADQLTFLFGETAGKLKSSALCPISAAGEPVGILAIASRQNHYFNVNLDTLFLDFIGSVVAAVLEGRLNR